jgi:hypothetical protein
MGRTFEFALDVTIRVASLVLDLKARRRAQDTNTG